MNIESCLNAAIEASTKAGNKLKENFLAPHELLADVGRDIKLSIDKEIEDEIKQHLEGFGFNFLGEETGFNSNQESKYFWVVDPLDGTANYFRNIPICANSIALMDLELNVHIAVVNDFLNDKLYFATKGNGAFCNNNPLKVSDIQQKVKAILMTGIPSKETYLDSEFEELINSFQEWKKVRMIGSAAIAGAWIAEGLADCYNEKGIFIWDIASTMLLVKEAGGMANITSPTPEMRVNARFFNGCIESIDC
jgi:myo-inositol-1(or 4)-monophosphatase